MRTKRWKKYLKWKWKTSRFFVWLTFAFLKPKKKNENLKFKFRHENRHKMKTGGWNVRNPSETTSVERFVLATKKVNGGTV